MSNNSLEQVLYLLAFTILVCTVMRLCSDTMNADQMHDDMVSLRQSIEQVNK